MTKALEVKPLSAEAFAPFGQVIETEGAERKLINQGKCTRFHDLAQVDTLGADARTLINLFRAEAYQLPLEIRMLEHHPLGSQAFMPMDPATQWLVIAAKSGTEVPDEPHAFRPVRGQGINFAPGTWHAVLTPIGQGADFLVVDRGGEGNNLVEHFFDEPYTICQESWDAHAV